MIIIKMFYIYIIALITMIIIVRMIVITITLVIVNICIVFVYNIYICTPHMYDMYDILYTSFGIGQANARQRTAMAMQETVGR